MKTILPFIAAIATVFSAGAQEAPIEFSGLPSEARSFIKTNFSSPFHHGIKEVESRKVSYEAVLNDNTEIEFDDSGRWKEVDGKGKAVPAALIQRPIQDYVKTNYQKQSIVKIERSDLAYEVKLSKGVELVFDPRGTFVKVD